MVDNIFGLDKDRTSTALRTIGRQIGGSQRSPEMFVMQGFGAAPTQYTANTRGRAWNQIKDAVEMTTALADQQAEQDDMQRRNAMIDEVMSDDSEMDARKLVKLQQLGIDTRALGKLGGAKDNGLSGSQLYQSLGNNPAMAKLALMQGHITQDQYDALKQGIDEERDYQRSLKAPSGGGSNRAETEAEFYNRDPEGYTAWKMAQRGKLPPDPNEVKRDKKGNIILSPEQALQKMDTESNDYEAILNDPRSEKELFSVQQSTLLPAIKESGNSESAGVLSRIAGQAAQNKTSPLAAQLDRMGAEQSFDVVAKLFPASDKDIKLALSLKPKVGDSRANIENYIKVRRDIIKKAKEGAYGVPSSGQDAPDDGQDDDEMLLGKYR